MDYLQGEPGERTQKIALFRHSIISPVLNTMEESQRQYFLKIAEKEHFVPGMGMKKFSISTLKTWLSKYRERGYEGLVPRVRRDKGSSRKVSPELKEFIEDILIKLPITTYTHLYSHLIEKNSPLREKF